MPTSCVPLRCGFSVHSGTCLVKDCQGGLSKGLGWAEQGTVSVCVTQGCRDSCFLEEETERPRDGLRKDKDKKTEKHKLRETDRETESH